MEAGWDREWNPRRLKSNAFKDWKVCVPTGRLIIARHAVLTFIHKSPSAKGALHASLGRRPRTRTAAIREGQRSVPYWVWRRIERAVGPSNLGMKAT